MRHLLFSNPETLKSHIGLPALPEELPHNQNFDEVAMITGATGFIGGFLMKELLHRRTFKTYVCLVRAANPAAGFRRLKETLMANGTPEELIEEAGITIVIGDVLLPRFGLEPGMYDQLLSETDHLFHFAATMNWVTPFNQETVANIQALKEAISFCANGKLKKLHYASSMGIWTLLNPQEGPIYEDQLHNQGEELPGGYFQSKWVNEHILKLARDSGIPVNVYRIGDVKGNSENGLGDPQNFGNLAMQYFIKSGLVIDKEVPEFNFIPVDFLAKAIVHLSVSQSNKTFQFSNSDLVSFRDIYQAAKDVGHDVHLLAMDDWMKALMKETSHYGRILKPIFKAFTPAPSVPMTSFYDIGVTMFKKPHDTTNTRSGLEGTNITCPGMLRDGVLNQYMQHLGETVIS